MNPPQNPGINTALTFAGIAGYDAAYPMTNDPTTLISNVHHGNVPPIAGAIADEIAYRATPPSALPNATAR